MGCGYVDVGGGVSEKFRNRPRESVAVAVVYAVGKKQHRKTINLFSCIGVHVFLIKKSDYRDRI